MLAVAGCGGVATRHVMSLPPLLHAAADLQDDVHLLTAGDVLLVEFPHRPEWNREVTVRTDGRITLPLLGSIEAANRRPEELRETIRRAYQELAYTPDALSPGREYLINVGDMLDIRFRSAESLNIVAKVRPDGRISLERVKSIVAEGKSPEALEAELIAAYRRHLVDPELVVIVQEYTSDRIYVDGVLVRPGARDLDDATIAVKSSVPRQVFVGGEVGAPGFLTYQAPLSALQAVLSRGGIQRGAKLDNVIVLRRPLQGDSASVILLNLANDLSGRSTNDILLRPFDIVIVPRTGIAQLNNFLDQYLYQLLPIARNANFSFFYDVRNRGVIVP